MRDKQDKVIRKDPAYKEAGRVDKLYQVFFDNKVWGTQLMGGFQVPTGSPYHPILSETLMNDSRVLKASTKNKSDNLSTAKKMIYSCVPNDGVLFLCESPLFSVSGKKDGKWEDEGYTGITVQKNAADGKVYSAIWKGDQDLEEKDIVCQIDIIDKKGKSKKFPSEDDYAVFEVSQKKVLVIHSSETTKDYWKDFLAKCCEMEIDYIVGDTNQTKTKNEKVKPKFYGDIKDFFETVSRGALGKWKISDLPKKSVVKNRIPLDGFQNNQLNKGFLEGFVDVDVQKLNDDQRVSEKDGMVILKRTMRKSECDSHRSRMEEATTRGQAATQNLEIQDTAKPMVHSRHARIGGRKRKRTRRKKKKRTKKGKKARRKRKTRAKTKGKRKRTRKMRTRKRRRRRR